MDSTLIIPTESPVAVDDIKRALITYEKVYLPSPDDRELIPPTSFMYAVSGGNPIASFIGLPMGPVRPLGKVDGYDDSFQKILTDCKDALAKNKIEVISTTGSET